MPRPSVVTTGRLQSALGNLLGQGAAEGGFQSMESAPAGTVSDEDVQLLQAIAKQLDQEDDENVLATRQDQVTSLLQSYLAEHEPAANTPMDAGGFEAMFDTRDVGWSRSALEWIKLKLKGKQPWVDPPKEAVDRTQQIADRRTG